MKAKTVQRIVRETLDAERLERGPITVETLRVCFTDRTVSLNGRTVRVETDCLDMPLLGGHALFIPKGNLERLA